MYKNHASLNANYGIRFGIGLALSLFFVLVVFNMNFENNPAPIFDFGDVEMSTFLPIDNRQIKDEKKIKLDKKVAIKMANSELIEDIKFKDELEPEPQKEASLADLIGKVTVQSPMAGPVRKMVKPVPKVIPQKKESKEIFMRVEEMPRFKGCMEKVKGRMGSCTTTKLLGFINDIIQYPTLARETNISGRVIAQFVVEKDGSVSNIKILRSPGGGLGAEAKRILEQLPKWIPGRQQGNPVRVRYIIPIVFKLE